MLAHINLYYELCCGLVFTQRYWKMSDMMQMIIYCRRQLEMKVRMRRKQVFDWLLVGW
jgi:hypothetical protein